MESEIDGRTVWVVAASDGIQWRLLGLYSSEARAEAARTHLREHGDGQTTSLVKFQLDEDLTSWWPERDRVAGEPGT